MGGGKPVGTKLVPVTVKVPPLLTMLRPASSREERMAMAPAAGDVDHHELRP
ncbi:MAG: hypothetical protein HKN82_08885 [Akkermansiaceae bacterium]|nr:hypothetical protein [Akkermansiaceae bacterium]